VTQQGRSALSFINDRANLLTLTGLLCGVLAISFSVRGAYAAASIALVWALFCDWFDGALARRTAGRTEEDRAFGGQLDSLVDMVSSGIAPAILLLSVGDFKPWFYPGAFLLVVAGALRLAHFNLFGQGTSEYRGLPIDTNIIVVTALFPLRDALGPSNFSSLLYVAVVTLAVLNVAPFRMPKLEGRWYYVIFAYVLAMTALNVCALVQ
jgi:phosphatidylserine synthase